MYLKKKKRKSNKAFLQARENFDVAQKTTFELAKQVVERSYPKKM